MADDKKAVPLKEAFKELHKLRDNPEALKDYIENARGSRHGGGYLGDLVGHGAQERHGLTGSKISTTEDLNSFLKSLIDKNYSGMDQLRTAINKDASPMKADFTRGMAGSGNYIPSLLEKSRNPIHMGSDTSFLDNADETIKGTLAHELGHSNDHLVELLQRGKLHFGEAWANKILSQLQDHPEYADKIVKQMENSVPAYTTRSADDLNPEKARQLQEMLLDSPPSARREQYLKFLENYDKTLSIPAKTSIGTDLGVPNSSIKPLPFEQGARRGISGDMPIPGYTEDALKTDLFHGQGHHLKNLAALPNDTGHFEFRNLIRMLKNQDLVSAAPFLAKAGLATAGGLASLGAEAAQEAFDVEPSGATPDMYEHWMEKGYSDDDSKAKAFKAGLEDHKEQIATPSRYEKPEVRKYKEANMNASPEDIQPNYVEPLSEDNRYSFDKVMGKFKNPEAAPQKEAAPPESTESILKQQVQDDMHPSFGEYLATRIPAVGEMIDTNKEDRLRRLSKLMGSKYER